MALRNFILLAFAAAGVVVAGCSADASSGDPAPAPTDTSGTTPPVPTGSTGADGGAAEGGLRPLGPPQSGGVMLDSHGGLHPFGGAKIDTANAASWPTQDIARALVVLSDGSGWCQRVIRLARAIFVSQADVSEDLQLGKSVPQRDRPFP